MAETLYDKLKKANDEYHEKVQDIMLDEGLDVKLKVPFAKEVHNAFEYMKTAGKVIEEHYKEE